jgi:hypothetical protein
MKRHAATFLIAIAAVSTCASGQNDAPSCSTAEAVGPQHLLGQWRAEISGQPGVAVVQFDQDPEQDDSLVGHITRGRQVSELAAEVQHGEFSMEESADGTRISATWAGQLTKAACGREIKGLWTDAHTDQSHPFVLRKQAGWQ